MPTSHCHTYTLDTGAGSKTGASAITSNFNPGRFGHYDALTVYLNVTKADTDAADVLDVALQETRDGVTWHDRARFANVTGDLTASATAPEVRRLVVQQFGSFADGEEELEPSGSAGGTRLTAGTVLNGPFPPLLRTGGTRQSSFRLYIEVTDADNDADFEGTIDVYGTYAIG